MRGTAVGADKGLGARAPGAARAEFAPAKVNLTLRVLGRRIDGYHELESLVVFATEGDSLGFVPGGELALAVRGAHGQAAGSPADNLVLKAARALAERVQGLRLGSFVLTKRLPVAAGLGGGSSDAGAALRLLARANGIALNDPRMIEAARVTGADVPVCLDPRARVMRGIGDILSAPLELPDLPAVLVNPGVALPTKAVFSALAMPMMDASSRPASGTAAGLAERPDRSALLALLAHEPNDLEPPAIGLQPAIARVLATMRGQEGCRLARMSGSGATCFALFDTRRLATTAARHLREVDPSWWVRATVLDAVRTGPGHAQTS